MEIANEDAFLVGDWRVCPPQGVLTRGEETVRLEPKAMEVLVYLASHPGEVISREALERDVWRGALVGYDAVTSTIIKLRKAFSDSAKRPNYIATVPKRGYRLVAPVNRDSPTNASESTEPTAPMAPTPAKVKLPPSGVVIWVSLILVFALGAAYLLLPNLLAESDILVPRKDEIPTLVVLPFANLGGDSERGYLADGMTEDVITSLSRLAGLRVIARNSAFAFAGADTDPREAAEQLGVRYVLQGSMLIAEDRLRVNAKLIDTTSGVHLWAEQFDGGTGDLFTLHDRVAQRTAEALSVTLTDRERRTLYTRPTTNFGAYDYYLRGRVTYGSLTARESALARAMYLRAIQEDPGFALAYAGLALTYIDDFRRHSGSERETAAAEAFKLAEQAVALDETLPQAHFAVGYVRLYGRADHEGAIAEAKRALTLNPNYADAYALLSSAYFFAGELERTLELDREAMRLNPASSFVYDMHRGRRHYLEGDFQEALDVFLLGAAKDYNYLPTQVWLAATYAKLGDLDEAEWAAEQVRILMPEFTIDDWIQQRPYKNADHREALISGLRLAGLE